MKGIDLYSFQNCPLVKDLVYEPRYGSKLDTTGIKKNAIKKMNSAQIGLLYFRA